MRECPACSTQLPDASRFCLTCGTNVGANGTAASVPSEATVALDDATIAMPAVAMSGGAPPTPPAVHPSRTTRARGGAAASLDDQRFPPGTLIAGRYRVIARLGKGGMGEVYRADDLVLGQEVALKFLPESATNNLNLLTRFYDEVRIARQVTHPNVCRMYDIGEVNGQPFLSMQYIDGEDLGALLRRIGRLPSDKAAEVGRKLCAGLAAAHEQGVLHRDLKPANIMIDARGQVLITDFGLAGIAEHLQGAEVRNGTPAYMAPEQLTGTEVSARSDIYALGLVLFEIFTGRAPFEAETMEEMIRQRQQSQWKSPSTLVHDVDPAVERIILRCLEPDPARRPASALAVAAALPGGDPLAAALAAGETPSPELVASAGDREALSPKAAIAALAGVALGLAGLFILMPPLRLASHFGLDNPPEVLDAKSRDILAALGYSPRSADHAHGFRYDSDYGDYLQAHAGPHADWGRLISLRPSILQFWYRSSPAPLQSEFFTDSGQVTRHDPPMALSGMASITVDPEGRLVSFEVVPPQREAAPASPPAPDWRPLFTAAGLDPARFQPAAPEWVPNVAIDARAAWTGTLASRTDLPLRVEAAAYHGKPVFFQLIGPWSKPERTPDNSTNAGNAVLAGLFIAIMVTAVAIARYNTRLGRGDARGAVRVGAAALVLSLCQWVCMADHVSGLGELTLAGQALADGLLSAFSLWVLYLAIEPWVRRRWPQTLITWSRLVSGRWRDPMVGRDLLFSVLFGIAYCLFIALYEFALARYGGQPAGDFNLTNLLGARAVAGYFFGHLLMGIRVGPIFFLMMFLLRVLLRNQWLAGAAFMIIWTLSKLPGNDHPWLAAPFYAIVYAILVIIMLRFGLFALAITTSLIDGINEALITTDIFAWYGVSSLAVLLLAGGMALVGFRMALGGRSLLNEKVLES